MINLRLKRGIAFLLTLLLAETFVNSAFAVKLVSESHVAIDPYKVELVGGNPGGQFGATLNSGDFNGDGIDDLAIGAPFFSSFGMEWNGSVSIIFGKKNLGNTLLDFSKIEPEIELLGHFSGNQFGTSIETGDYNSDGIDDIAVGAFNAKGDKERPGKVYIYYGELTWGSRHIDSAYYKPSVELVGVDSGDSFGLSLSTMDVDNDDIDDLLVGAPFANSHHFSGRVDNAGVVYVYFGGESGLSTLYDIKFCGQVKDERFGSAIAGGDLNADGKTDVVIGAYTSPSSTFGQMGKVYIYDGEQNLDSGIIRVTNILRGDILDGWFSFALDVADIDGDDMDDVAVSSFPYLNQNESGKVSIYRGGIRGLDDVVDIVIDEPLHGNLAGASVLLEDLNSDGVADIVVGAPGVGNPVSLEEGDTYILYSGYYDSTNGQQKFSIQEKSITSILHGENADDWFGYSLTNLDINGDGYQDLAIGSRYSDTFESVNNGKVFVLLGNNFPFGNKKRVMDLRADYLTRGESLSLIMEELDIEEKKADDMDRCYDYAEFCLFNFLAMSSYDDVQLEPNLILYPDVLPGDKYYEDIISATMLGLVNGYQDENDSPFHPDNSISRIQALKIVLSASDLITSKYRFELINDLGNWESLTNQSSYFADVNAKISYMWWYPRYINFAVEHNIVDKSEFFRPDENITRGELDDIVDRTLRYLNS